MPVEDVVIPDEVAVTPLSDETIAKQRAAATRNEPAVDKDHVAIQPDEPPRSDLFNQMSKKLEDALREAKIEQAKPPAPQQDKPADKPADAQATPDKPAEPPEDKVFTSAKAADWKALKQKIKDAETQANDWKQKHELTSKEYDEFKKKAADLAKFEETNKALQTIKEEKEKLQAQLETVALERSESFSRPFDKAFATAVSSAREAVGVSADKIEQLLQLPPSKWRKERINEIREELAGVDQGQLDIAIAEYDKARAEKDEALKNSKVNYQRMLDMQSERQNRERQLEQERIKATVASVLDVAKQYDAFKELDGNADHNAGVVKNRETVTRFLNGELPTNEMAMMPVVAAEGRRLMETVLPALTKKIQELEEAVKGYQAANPKPSGGQQAQHSDQPSDFITKFNQLWPQGNR